MKEQTTLRYIKAFFYQDVSNGAAVFVQTSQSSYCLTTPSTVSNWYHKVIVKKESERPRTTRSVIRQYYAFVINGILLLDEA
uniref:Uncharacterized protein n=1 Tax=Magallana gigas TaxID=29159 RepID=K1R4R0_MAGGI